MENYTPNPHPLPHSPPEPPLTLTVLANESTVTFKNESDGKHVELDVRGTWYDRSASVTFGGEPVAHISRSIFNMREIFADKDTVSSFFFYDCGEGTWLMYVGLVLRDCGADGGFDYDCGAVRVVG